MKQLWSRYLPCFLLVIGLALTTSLAKQSNYLGQVGAARVSVVSSDNEPLCNSHGFAQLPDRRELFIGRAKQRTTSDLCSGEYWFLDLFEMDWNGNTLRSIGHLLPTTETAAVPVFPTSYALSSAYDPSVAAFNGEYWIAFECVAFRNHRAWELGTSSCVAPLETSDGVRGLHVDPRRISVVVTGTAVDPGSPYRFTASIPKLLVYGSKLYLYWGAIQIRKSDRKWLGSSHRGAQLTQEPGEFRRMWVIDSNGEPISSNDPRRTTEVFGVNKADPQSDSIATIFSVTPMRDLIYAVGAVGGNGCAKPSDPIPGCFRLQIVRTSDPLGYHAFNKAILQSPVPVNNPQEYTQLFVDPSGRSFLMGFYDTSVRSDTPSLPRGLWRYPLDIRALRFGPPGDRSEP